MMRMHYFFTHKLYNFCQFGSRWEDTYQIFGYLSALQCFETLPDTDTEPNNLLDYQLLGRPCELIN